MGASHSISLGCPGYECSVGGTFDILQAAERGDVAAIAKVLSQCPAALRHHALTSSDLAVHIAAQGGHLAVLEHITAFVAERCSSIGWLLSRSQSSRYSSRRTRLSSSQASTPPCMTPALDGFASPSCGASSCAAAAPSCDGSLVHDVRPRRSFQALRDSISGRSYDGGSLDSHVAPVVSAQTQLMHVQMEVAYVLDAHNHKGQTPLMHASYHGHPAVVVYLLQQGADPWAISKCGGRTALHYAALSGQDACVRALLDSLPEDATQKATALVNKVTTAGYSPLLYAVAARHLPTVKALLSHRPNILLATNDCSTPDEPVAMNGCMAVTALDLAARFGLHAIAVELLRYHFESGGGTQQDPRRRVNSWGWRPEATALRWGQFTMIELLLPQGHLEGFASDDLHYVGVPQLQFMAAQALRTQLLTTLAASDHGPGGGTSPGAAAARSAGGAGSGPIAGVGGSTAGGDGASTSTCAAAADMDDCLRAPPKRLPTGGHGGDDASCGVCLEDEAGMVQLLPCRHSLCPTCAANMARQLCLHPVRCPFCRSPLNAFGTVAARAVSRQVSGAARA